MTGKLRFVSTLLVIMSPITRQSFLHSDIHTFGSMTGFNVLALAIPKQSTFKPPTNSNSN